MDKQVITRNYCIVERPSMKGIRRWINSLYPVDSLYETAETGDFVLVKLPPGVDAFEVIELFLQEKYG
jgi:hypothetical protein